MKNWLVFLSVFICFSAFSQDSRELILAEQSLKINKKYLPDFFEEVYKGSPYKYDSEMERIYLDQMERIEIINIPYFENQNHRNLSSFERMDKYNAHMSFEELTNFNPEKFNFIKYAFNLFQPFDQWIRVDNQDYLIVIKAYKKK